VVGAAASALAIVQFTMLVIGTKNEQAALVSPGGIDHVAGS